MITEIRAVFPGDSIHEEGKHCFGIHNKKATIIGMLSKIDGLYFIKSKTKKYCPTKHDIIIGKVIYVSSEYYKLDVSGHIGLLPALSFTNAVKRNRPILNRGNYVAARVVRVESGDLFLSCREDGLGLVDEVWNIETWKVRHLYFDSFLRVFGLKHTYQVILGMNGFIWIAAEPEIKRKLLDEISNKIV